MINAADFKDAAGNPLRGGGDDAQCVQAAVNSAGGAGSIALGSGPLIFKSPIIINGQIRIIGDGSNVTQINVAAPIDGDILQFGSLQENLGWAGMYGVEISLSSTHTGGALIHAVNTHDFGVDDVVTWGAFNTIVQITGGSAEFISRLRNCEFNSNGPVAILVDGYAQDVYLYDLTLGGSNTGQTGIFLQDCSGENIRDVDIISFVGYGYAAYPGAGQTVREVFVDSMQVDGCNQGAGVQSGAIIGTTNGNNTRHHYANCWFSDNKGDGMCVGQITGVEFLHPITYVNADYGVRIVSGADYVKYSQACSGGNANGDVVDLSGASHNQIDAPFVMPIV